jgi:hypothetical protein
VDVHPHHFEPDAPPPEMWWGEPDVPLKKGGWRFCFLVEVEDKSLLEQLNMRADQVYENAFKENDDE